MKTKFIFTTGGVLSGLGKGVTAASVGNLLKSQGFSIFVLKLDPYLNIDPGVMNPIEHGEVYVTSDGGETDLDLGHYERFIDVKLAKDSNFTTGRIFTRIFQKERKGDYHGKTVQIVPHVVDEIIDIILSLAEQKQPDFMLIEIGGTVGDLESSPYIYAISKFASLYPRNVMFSHLAFVPYLSASKEYKSKPSQVSIASLRSFGINPNLLLLRSQEGIDKSIIKKVSENAFLKPENVINIPDKANIYEIPLFLEKSGIVKIIYDHFGIEKEIIPNANAVWNEFTQKYLAKRQKPLNLLLVGKYTGLEDAYLSIISSLKIAAAHQNIDLNYTLIDSSDITQSNINEKLAGYDGVMILPGFGVRGFYSKVEVAEYTRDHKIPTLGICLGFQAMAVAQARKMGISNATSKEFAVQGQDQEFILTPFYENGDTMNLGGTLRLGEDKILALPDTLAQSIYGSEIFYERHRHRYEIADKYRHNLEDEEFKFSGIHPELKVAEICELKNHPFYLGVQYHPEFSTRVIKSNPLFDSFLKMTWEHKNK
ncbi:CTP synthase (UTP-ammonia ligase) [Mycoplasmopsis californica HAZ160_1]|uniref:CTP synthase (glutamine hydrolyzing) n=1 Tax=Mycoplasmopsis californica HAZ160_1 TaxID=1397850 RepID=A0AAT9F8G0_9BACT|nr:CTP synthase [Mycoplasmopsis californica]BAP01169.1 CTP synthase (UTP-ammonia ligase) [Mycoplasmopsis californica HAZ160_1]BBG41037.1 CTP synthase [Mycoplasmopsis californica]BBG41630.1 CTP synthase [Mycoplasmopsis californica]BBG42224.1 CTP synthase [Mycoplasmopsis californica]BBG42804.1 CTP synthase [Mycoplasmopsis californica]